MHCLAYLNPCAMKKKISYEPEKIVRNSSYIIYLGMVIFVMNLIVKSIVVVLKVLLLFLLLLVTALAVLVLCPINRVYFYNHIRKFCSTSLLMMLQVDLKVNNPHLVKNPRGVMFACNHVTWLDIIVIMRLFQINFISAIEIKSWPLIGKIVRNSGSLFIDRKKRGDVDRINKEIGELLTQGFNVAFFPEGKTTKGDSLIPYHSALFESAILNKSLVVPMIIKYMDNGKYTPLASFAGLGFFACLMNILSIKKFQIEVNLLEPVAASEFADRRELCNYVYDESSKLFADFG